MLILLIVLLNIIVANGFMPLSSSSLLSGQKSSKLNMITNTGRNQYIDINGGKICYDYFPYSKKPAIGILQRSFIFTYLFIFISNS
jgi:hypothetical protein